MNQDSSNDTSDYLCWDFSSAEEVSYPIIPVHVLNSKNNLSIRLEAKVDTGFNGVIGLTEDQINELQLQSRGSTMIRSAIGMKSLEFYELEFSIPGSNFSRLRGICIQTPRSLVGRTVLHLGSWLYDGKAEKWCLI